MPQNQNGNRFCVLLSRDIFPNRKKWWNILKIRDKTEKGFSIVEILVVVFIVAVTLTSLLNLATFSLNRSTLIKQTIQANNIAQETVEIIRNFRDGTDWATDGLGTLTAGIPYYPQKSADNPPKWQLSQVEETLNGFTRKVVLSNVMRDSNDNIVENGGVDDPGTKKAAITVSWRDKKIELIAYFTNWKQ